MALVIAGSDWDGEHPVDGLAGAGGDLGRDPDLR